MIEPWNDANLQPPPVNTCSSETSADVKDLRHICNNIILILSRQSPLHREGAVFSRLVYKYDKKFRHDIGYRYFKKVNIGLKRYLAIKLLKDIENFVGILPEKNNDYLPTRQMLEYILVRLMTFSKIMVRICICTKQAAIFYLNRVKNGESYWMSLTPYALLSRIWSLSLVLTKHAVRWYNSLHQYVNQLQIKGLNFLPENYTLPDNLELWLNMKNLDCFGRFEWSQKHGVEIDLSLDDDNDIGIFENLLGHVNKLCEDNQEIDLGLTVNEKRDTQQLDIGETKIDHGEAVSRDTFNMLLNCQTKKQAIVCKHDINGIKDTPTLETFLHKEEIYRNENNAMSLTNHLSFMQWESLKRALNNLRNTSGNKNIEKKIKNIWKEKCEDCLY
uniref:Nucleolus and neural progenitor protein-like N-terminal domain-containing protein n=1 Tax=Bombyx mori TaxID=7091 RepID=A0A8R2QWH4_BOMMO|nr:uncharacterized protein LOC119629296 [Bombyx mori]